MAKPDLEEKLQEKIASFRDNPLGFVLYAYPWGEKGRLLEEPGPDVWQIEALKQIGAACQNVEDALRMAVKSGHGVGKTAFLAWVVHWFISTRDHPQIIVTANTLPQLMGKTWRELAKWHKLSIHKDWFEWTATKFYLKDHPETWFANAIPWSENNPEAFAGTHEKHVLVVFDEASAIDDKIWEVVEGAMTTKGAMWFAFGNPTRNNGRFFECFHKFKHRWEHRTVDAREARKANLKEINKWKEDYGDDSDFFRVRVRGEFPRASWAQFIPHDVVERCRKYEAEAWEVFPRILGVDIARFGDDQTVFCIRQGRRVFPLRKFRGLDIMQVASLVAQTIKEEKIQGVFVDGVGLGIGVVDRLRQLGFQTVDVQSGAKPNNLKYFNKRAEMWAEMRDFLKEGCQLPDDQELFDDLLGPEYTFENRLNLLQLEKKEDMKARGLASPDCADALAFTFYAPIAFIDEQELEPEVYED